jgi:hypothetical protein
MVDNKKVAKSVLPTDNLVEVTSKVAVEAANANLVNSLVDRLDDKDAKISELNNLVRSRDITIAEKNNTISDLEKNGKKVYVYKNNAPSMYGLSMCGTLSSEGDEAKAEIRADVKRELEETYKERLESVEELEVSHKKEIANLEHKYELDKIELKKTISKSESVLKKAKADHELEIANLNARHYASESNTEKNYVFWKTKYEKRYEELKEKFENLKDKGVVTSLKDEVEFYRAKAKSFWGFIMPTYSPCKA